ncbi:MAG TPA: nuclear transport factor 2 family protein [Anaerolineae bacterium]|nr:nuclear transport factor 2 family protein [Anaerolineae bacterium]
MDAEEAKELVLRFLRLMEGRDLAAATSLMAPNPVIIFPGGKQFASQDEMVAGAQGRYQWIKKTFERLDVCQDGADTVVYVMGTLYGVNRHGVSFADIRYIDRFALRDGPIVRQEVWNDLAESGALERIGE